MRIIFLVLTILPLFVIGQNTYPFPQIGNVGIGTTSPAYPLDVNGAIRAGQFAIGAANAQSDINAQGNNGNITINSSLVNATMPYEGGTFNIGDYSTRIGNGAHLSLFNSQGSGYLWVGLSLNYYQIFSQSPQTGAGRYDWSILGESYRLFELGQGTVKMPVLSTGVGGGVRPLLIGEDGSTISSPTFTFNGNTLGVGGSDAYGNILLKNNLNYNSYLTAANNGTLHVKGFHRITMENNQVDGAYRHFVTFDEEGKALFGQTTSSGNYKVQVTGGLAVNGDAIFTKVKVKQYSTWPDYVFESTYSLPSLQEVEAYIKKHKRLPEVPSAQEVEKEGLDLGGTQAVLLKKIEELTLYIIEQDNKITGQQKQIDSLINENEKFKKQSEMIYLLNKEIASIKKILSQ